MIDGSFGEGGGQILRTALSFSAISGRPIEIHSIRGGRPKPGLQAQHLVCVQAAAAVCEAEVKGGAVGSMFLSFQPGKGAEPGDYRFDIGTAGSTNLVLQTLFPILSMCPEPSHVTVTGGTHNPKAPTVDYLREVFAPTVSHFGWHLDVECPVPGFYPGGGGRIEAKISPAEPLAFDLDAFPEEHVLKAVIHSSLDREDLFLRSKAAIADRHEPDSAGIQFEKIFQTGPSPGIAASLFAIAGYHRAGFTALGARQKSMEVVSNEVYDEYEKWRKLEPAVDEHLADQLVPLAALTQGQSSWRAQTVTDHLRTVLQLVEWFEMGTTHLDEETGSVRVTR